MRTFTALVAICALAACSNEAADTGEVDVDGASSVSDEGIDPEADAGFEAVAPGNYEVVSADGLVDQLTILPGMTWAMVSADGNATGGTIFAQDGQNCFVTEGVDDHQCFEATNVDEDGTIQVRGAGGEMSTVRPVDSFE